MKNIESWVPTKFQFRDGKLRATNDIGYVRPGSKLFVDLIAAYYPSLLNVHARGVLLDLGCGNAPLYGAYREMVDEVICIDWQKSPHSISYIDEICDLNESIPLADNSVDTILISDVLEHIAKPWILWSEVSRVLRPGGSVVGNVPFLYWIHEEPHDYHRYTEFGLRRYAEDNRLTVQHLEAFGGLVEVLGDIFSKGIAVLPFIGKPAATWLAALVFFWHKTRFGQTVKNKSAKFFPAGYFFAMTKPASLIHVSLGAVT